MCIRDRTKGWQNPEKSIIGYLGDRKHQKQTEEEMGGWRCGGCEGQGVRNWKGRRRTKWIGGGDWGGQGPIEEKRD